MKKVLLLALCFLISTTCAYGELQQSDFEKIQSIIDKSVEKVEKSIEKSEKQIKEYIDLKIDAVNTRIDAVEKSVGRNFYLIIATFTLIVVAVGIPQAIIAMQSKKYDKLIEDVEMLKQQRIVNP